MAQNKITNIILGQFYEELGLINEEMNENLYFEAYGKRLIQLDLDQIIEYKDYLDRTAGTTFEKIWAQKRIQRLQENITKFDTNGARLQETEIEMVKKAIFERDEIRKDHPHYNKIRLPQWMILNKIGLPSIENNVRKNQMMTFGRIITKARPIHEFNEVIEFATDRFIRGDGRAVANYPYFKSTLRRDKKANKKLLKRSTPEIWFYEFNRHSNAMKKAIKEPGYVNRIKKFYENRCHHTENTTKKCFNCNQPENDYRINYSLGTIRAILDTQSEQKTVTEIVDESIEDYQIMEIQMDQEGHIFYNISNRDQIRLQRRLRELLEERI